MTKTQIYLEPDQHHALRAEAMKKHLSLAALLRVIVEDHFSNVDRTVGSPSASLYRSLVGIGKGGSPEISEQHDAYLGRAVDEHRRHSAR